MGPDVSVVVPCHDEADNLVPLVDEIRRALAARASYEIIITDDASTDGSWEIVRRLAAADPRVRGQRFARQCGQSAALWAGIRAAQAPVIVTLDADLQNPPADIPRLLDALAGADCVCGTRVESRGQGDGVVRVVSSRIANRVRNAVSGETISDAGCCFRAFRRECVEGVKFFDGAHRFLPTLIRMEGFRVVELPVGHRQRRAGRSHYGVWNRLFRSSGDLLAVRWMQRRALRYRVDEAVNPALPAVPRLPTAAGREPVVTPEPGGRDERAAAGLDPSRRPWSLLGLLALPVGAHAVGGWTYLLPALMLALGLLPDRLVARRWPPSPVAGAALAWIGRWRYVLPVPFFGLLMATPALAEGRPVLDGAFDLTGGLLVAGGLLLRLWEVGSGAMATGPERLVATGPHAFMRHPRGLALVLIAVGIAVLAESGPGILVIAGVTIGVYRVAAARDEARLAARFGDAYAEYCLQVPRYPRPSAALLRAALRESGWRSLYADFPATAGLAVVAIATDLLR